MLNDLIDTYGFGMPEIFPGGFSPEYQTVYDAFITKPPDDVAEDQDQMVRGMIADGVWDMLDIFYVTAAQSAADSLINWINPGTHDLTVVNLIAGLFTVYRGWTGNGVNGYLDTHYNPNTDAINYALNNASFGVYVRTNINEDGIDIGVQVVGHSRFYTRYLNNHYAVVNSVGTPPGANLDSRGFNIANRTLVNQWYSYRNKIIIINDNSVSTAIPTNVFYILANNNNGVANLWSTKQIAAAFAGGGMTQVNVNNFTDRLETFMDSIGAGVIP